MKLSAFFHDVGKAFTNNKTFFGHEEKGAQIFKKIGKELSLGKEATLFVSKLIKHHLDIFRLLELYMGKNLSNKDLNFFWYENKNYAVYLFILTLSDAYATSEDNTYFEKLREFIIYLQIYYFDVYTKNIIEEPLLSGKEIMDILGLKPSPEVGVVKKKLQKAQIEGAVKTKQEAIAFIKSLS